MEKLIGLFVNVRILFLLGIISSGCVDNELRNKAFERSLFVIDNLDNDSIYIFFSKKYFREEDINALAKQVKANCNYENRQNNFIGDYYERRLGSNLDAVSFEYEMFLECDTLRVVLKFELKSEPEIVGFRIDPID